MRIQVQRRMLRLIVKSKQHRSVLSAHLSPLLQIIYNQEQKQVHKALLLERPLEPLEQLQEMGLVEYSMLRSHSLLLVEWLQSKRPRVVSVLYKIES